MLVIPPPVCEVNGENNSSTVEDGAFGDDAWSTEAHDWDVICAAPYLIVSSKLYVLKHLHLRRIGCQLTHYRAPILLYKHNAKFHTPERRLLLKTCKDRYQRLLVASLAVYVAKYINKGQKSHQSGNIADILYGCNSLIQVNAGKGTFSV
ncbi:hypothetical protein TNCV_4398121 [Trichonephila clavipes]|nr:hypothetical protein TNCV_4398121 [Trichonephila clavipes]